MKRFLLVLLIVFLGGTLFAFPPYSSLCVYLKDIDGWNASECDGMNLKSSTEEMVSVSKTYSRGVKSVNVTIVGGTNASSYWAPFQSYFQLDTPKEMIRSLSVKGFNIGIIYYKKERYGSIIVPVAKEAPDIVSGVLMFNFSNMDWKEALEFSKEFDWEKIKEAF